MQIELSQNADDSTWAWLMYDDEHDNLLVAGGSRYATQASCREAIERFQRAVYQAKIPHRQEANGPLRHRTSQSTVAP